VNTPLFFTAKLDGRCLVLFAVVVALVTLARQPTLPRPSSYFSHSHMSSNTVGGFSLPKQSKPKVLIFYTLRALLSAHLSPTLPLLISNTFFLAIRGRDVAPFYDALFESCVLKTKTSGRDSLFFFFQTGPLFTSKSCSFPPEDQCRRQIKLEEPLR